MNSKKRFFVSKVFAVLLAAVILMGSHHPIVAVESDDSLLYPYETLEFIIPEDGYFDFSPFVQPDTVRERSLSGSLSDAVTELDLTHLVRPESQDSRFYDNEFSAAFNNEMIDIAHFNLPPEDAFIVDDGVPLSVLNLTDDYLIPHDAMRQLQTSEPEYNDAYLSSEPITRNTFVTFAYRGSGHTGGMPPANHSSLTPGLVTFALQGMMVRENHVFLGWRDTAGVLVLPNYIIPAGARINIPFPFSGTVFFDAHWEPAVVTFQYRSTGHTGGAIPQSHSAVTPGIVQLRPQGTLRRTGYVLAGWRDTQGALFQPGTVIPLGLPLNFPNPLRGTVTLDAHWVPANVTIEYRGNGNTGGAVPLSHTVRTPGSAVVRSPGMLARSGHMFYAWRTANGQFVDPGTSIVFHVETEGVLALYAHWVPATVRITYRSTGHTSGNVPADHLVATPGSTHLSSRGSLTRTGHTFGGWRNSAGGIFREELLVHFPQATFGVVTLDAVWLPNVILNYEILVNTSVTATEANSLVTGVSGGLRREFGIYPIGHGSRSTIELNQRSSCSRVTPPDDYCDSTCGPLTFVGCRDSHHRSRHHFFDVQRATGTTSVFRFVDFILCRFDANHGHGLINGSATLLGRDIIVTTRSDNPRRTTVHEISHLFGARDTHETPCIVGQMCVMTPGADTYNRWCDAHWIEVMENRNRR